VVAHPGRRLGIRTRSLQWPLNGGSPCYRWRQIFSRLFFSTGVSLFLVLDLFSPSPSSQFFRLRVWSLSFFFCTREIDQSVRSFFRHPSRETASGTGPRHHSLVAPGGLTTLHPLSTRKKGLISPFIIVVFVVFVVVVVVVVLRPVSNICLAVSPSVRPFVRSLVRLQRPLNRRPSKTSLGFVLGSVKLSM
jgi:hypothetical protein